MKDKSNIKPFLLLHLAVFILSLSTVCSKFAASQEFRSFNFIALYAGVIIALGIYALIWQQVLKKIPLTTAFVNKSATLIWSLIWGVSFFNETISASMIIGIIIVFCGVILVVTGPKKESQSKQQEVESDE